jgi:UDP-N-acetylmuramoyl-L-alanyl-D-glutamate--2,6-diaminopimelate ligase
MAGGFNVLNALCAIAAAGEAGFDPQAVATAISHTHGVPGRLESVHAGQAWSAIVDYAHKPDAVQAALQALRPVTEGKLIVVLGAGGDRDHGKRPLMAAIAAANADVVIITDDNPRTEDPATIRAELLAGVPSDTRAQVVEIGDRREAIAHAVSLAQGSDTVLVAGKGHESGQEINGVLHPFDDRIVLGEEIGKRL